jgi:translation elongation factor EF-4
MVIESKGFFADLYEPIIDARILMPPDYVGPVMQLCMEKRGVQKNLRYLGSQVQMEIEMPLAERIERWTTMYDAVIRNDVSAWREDFLGVLTRLPGRN